MEKSAGAAYLHLHLKTSWRLLSNACVCKKKENFVSTTEENCTEINK